MIEGHKLSSPSLLDPFTLVLFHRFRRLIVPPHSFTQHPAHAIFSTVLPEWRNWQTQQTQNLPGITPRVGSTPSSGTIRSLHILGTFA